MMAEIGRGHRRQLLRLVVRLTGVAASCAALTTL
jgi:hypothetical protein